jgi:hypothetical protein
VEANSFVQFISVDFFACYLDGVWQLVSFPFISKTNWMNVLLKYHYEQIEVS